MCLSIFLAQVLGCYIFLMSLAMIVHQQRFRKTVLEFMASHPLVAFSGGISLVFGLLIVTSHNIWVAMWPVLITIIGWLLIIQGVMRIFFPDHCVRFCKHLMAKNGYVVWCWVWLIIGLYLIWAGFSQM